MLIMDKDHLIKLFWKISQSFCRLDANSISPYVDRMLAFAVRTWDWTTLSFIWRLESHFCHWIWASIGRLPFWVIWWQALPQLHLWMPSCWDSCWQVDHQSKFNIVVLLLVSNCSKSLLPSFCLKWKTLEGKFANVGTIIFQVVLPEGAKGPSAVVPFPVEQRLEVIIHDTNFLWILWFVYYVSELYSHVYFCRPSILTLMS